MAQLANHIVVLLEEKTREGGGGAHPAEGR